MSSEVLVPAEYARHPQERVGSENLLAKGHIKGKGQRALCLLLYALGALCPVSAAAAAEGGTIKGRVIFTGKEPGNRVIRMGVDPMCAAANAGNRPVDEVFLVGDGSTLGNVFVKLEGSFPATPVPPQPVEIDQRA